MIWIVLGIILLIIVDRVLTPKLLRSLTYRAEINCIMTEPNETVTLESTVENHRRIPIPFIRLQIQLPLDAAISDAACRSHNRDSLFHRNVEEKFSVRARHCVKKKLRFCMLRRGSYEVGKYQLSVGDLFGLREESNFGKGQSLVVIPSRTDSSPAVEALAGFLGDISVRRFIMDDPILTVGFRDYTGREPLKNISWTRTAISGALQVKEFDRTAEQNVTVLLNVSGGSDEELEECFRLTRTVCEQLEQHKIPYGFRTNGYLPGATGALFKVPEGLGHNHLSTILYALGGANYTCFFSLSSLIRQALLARKHNEAFIVITPKTDENDSAALERLKSASASPICVLTAKEVHDE